LAGFGHPATGALVAWAEGPRGFKRDPAGLNFADTTRVGNERWLTALLRCVRLVRNKSGVTKAVWHDWTEVERLELEQMRLPLEAGELALALDMLQMRSQHMAFPHKAAAQAVAGLDMLAYMGGWEPHDWVSKQSREWAKRVTGRKNRKRIRHSVSNIRVAALSKALIKSWAEVCRVLNLLDPSREETEAVRMHACVVTGVHGMLRGDGLKNLVMPTGAWAELGNSQLDDQRTTRRLNLYTVDKSKARHIELVWASKKVGRALVDQPEVCAIRALRAWIWLRATMGWPLPAREKAPTTASNEVWAYNLGLGGGSTPKKMASWFEEHGLATKTSVAAGPGPRRRVSVHSLRATGACILVDVVGLEATARAGGWENSRLVATVYAAGKIPDVGQALLARPTGEDTVANVEEQQPAATSQSEDSQQEWRPEGRGNTGETGEEKGTGLDLLTLDAVGGTVVTPLSPNTLEELFIMQDDLADDEHDSDGSWSAEEL
jgi:hypothetical protein